MPPASASHPAHEEPLEEVPHAVLLTTVRALHLRAPPSFLAAPIAAAARAATDSLRVVVLSPLFNLPAPTSEPTHASTSAPASAPVTVTAPLDDEDCDDAAPGLSRTAHWDAVQRLLTFAYVQATAAAQERGRVLLDVDVLLRGTAEPFPEEVPTGAGRIYLGASVCFRFRPPTLHFASLVSLFRLHTWWGVLSISPLLRLGSAAEK